MIMSGEYDKMIPMDILPEYLVKAILSKNIEDMEKLGIGAATSGPVTPTTVPNS